MTTADDRARLNAQRSHPSAGLRRAQIGQRISSVMGLPPMRRRGRGGSGA
jgi:hypothetical protein